MVFSLTLPPQVARASRTVKAFLPPLNFITLHYAYYITVCLVSAVVFWGSSTPTKSVSFVDSLFLCVSAMTEAGLNTVNLSEVNTFQQFMMFFLILIGSAILISSAVLHTRKKSFQRRFASIVEDEKNRKRRTSSGTSGNHGIRGRVRAGLFIDVQTTDNEEAIVDTQDGEHELKSTGSDAAQKPNDSPKHVRFSQSSPLSPRAHRRVLSMSGVGARPDLQNLPRSAHAPEHPVVMKRILSDARRESNASISTCMGSTVSVARNSQFYSLTLAERERLGGVEYRALVILDKIVILYYVLWQLIACLGLGAWIYQHAPNVARANGLNPWWLGAFNGASAFNNSGMSLLDANMVAFQTSCYMLLTMGLLILAGNTCYPVFLRLIIWTLYQLIPDGSRFHEHKVTLRFLLDHPRRCYTTLFPSSETWWLLASLVVLNGIDWLAFEVLNIGNDSITTLPTTPRIVDGLFQALAVRSGGFYVVIVSDLRIGLLVLYVLMMYISVYPVTITIRNSNVYEERSLGIYADDPSAAEERLNFSTKYLPSFFDRIHSSNANSRSYFVRQQLRGQLAHDLWWICVAVLLITIIESSSFAADPVTFSVFNIVFETVSAYGCVGISVGAPNVAYSFCGTWHALSKLILCAVMLRGRHRGLPVAIDRAVLLAEEHLGATEEQDAVLRRDRTVSREEGSRVEDGEGRLV